MRWLRQESFDVERIVESNEGWNIPEVVEWIQRKEFMNGRQPVGPEWQRGFAGAEL